MRKALLIVIGIMCVLVVGVLLFIKISNEVNFEKQFADIKNYGWCEISKDGSYMKLDTNPYDTEQRYVNEVVAVNGIADANIALGFSDVLMEKMMNTRARDGRQYDENDKVKVSWTFGEVMNLEVIYEKK